MFTVERIFRLKLRYLIAVVSERGDDCIPIKVCLLNLRLQSAVNGISKILLNHLSIFNQPD